MRAARVCFVLLLASTVVLVNWAVTASAYSPSSWPTGGQNFQRTGQSPVVGSHVNTLKWRFQTEGAIFFDPALRGNTIYVGSQDGRLYVVNPDGTERTRISLGGIVGTPTLLADGRVLVPADGCLHALTSTLTPDWVYCTAGQEMTSPLVAADGSIFVGSTDGTLYALNPDGTERWRFQTQGLIEATALGRDGTVYTGSRFPDGRIYAVAPSGSPKWSFQTGCNGLGSFCEVISLAVGPDDTVYAGADDGFVYALTPDGLLKWQFDTGATNSEPGLAVSSQGTVLAATASNGGTLFAILSSGSELWRFVLGSRIRPSPAIGSDGVVYVGAENARVYAINPDGTERWNFAAVMPFNHPAIAGDGTILIGSLDRHLYAIGELAFHVDIDIKPGSEPNSINLGTGGVTPVAILSGQNFDAASVDPATVTLASAPVSLKGQGLPQASLEDVNGDGLLDLVVQVSSEALELFENDTTAMVTGRTFSGMLISGTDSVRIVP